jgi:ABC-type multidrug transport system, ATPase component
MIELNNLSKRYDDNFMALNNITCSIGTGVLGLLGKNGAGKSTLLKILATVLEPSAGNMRMHGLDGCRDKVAIRRQLGYLPQEFGLYNRLTGSEMLEYFAVLKGITDKKRRKAQVDVVMEQLNLSGMKDRRIFEYSQGMKQRLGIAQALLGSPRFLVLDEPTAGLDPIERNNICNIIRELGRKIPIVYATHIFADLVACCSGIVVLHRGELLFNGKIDDFTKLLTAQATTTDELTKEQEFLSLRELIR